MANGISSMSCRPEEIYFLAGLLGARVLVGVPDPFVGWLTEEIEEAWVRARENLARSRFIEVNRGGGITMDSSVAAMVGACSFPKASLVLTQTAAAGARYSCLFHVGEDLAVEQVVSPTKPPVCRIVARGDARGVLQRIGDIFALDGQTSPGVPAGSLPDSLLAEARAAAGQSGEKAADALLHKAGLDPGTAAALAATLTRPRTNGALVAVTQRGASWKVVGMGLLEGDSGLWTLRLFSRGGRDWVEVTPCDALEIRAAIVGIMNRVLPAAMRVEG